MHPQAADFVQRLKKKFPLNFAGATVLEIGSYNINGTARDFFPDPKEYIGVDLIAGPGVDLVKSGHEVMFPNTFDTTISMECFEHNPYWAETFLNMMQHTKPGGLVVMTCASTGRNEHGTIRANSADAPGTIARGWGEYYKNLTPKDFYTLFQLEDWFEVFKFEYSPVNCDLYFYGVRKDDRTIQHKL